MKALVVRADDVFFLSVGHIYVSRVRKPLGKPVAVTDRRLNQNSVRDPHSVKLFLKFIVSFAKSLCLVYGRVALGNESHSEKNAIRYSVFVLIAYIVAKLVKVVDGKCHYRIKVKISFIHTVLTFLYT